MSYSNDAQASIPKPKMKKAQAVGLSGAMMAKALPELFINANSRSGKGLTKGTLNNKNLALDRVIKRANNQVGAVNRHVAKKIPAGRSLADAKRLSPMFEKRMKIYDSNTKKSKLYENNIRKNTLRINQELTKAKVSKSYNKGVFADKVIKTMGRLSPLGSVAFIMAPKKVGDATLKGNQGEYKRVK